MSFIAPLSLLLGLLAGPIILMYMLRLRRKEVLISSTFLWQELLRDQEANAPWQKLRRNLLLLLQLLILAFLVLALARPFWPVPSLISGNVVVLLDSSASMQATDVEPSRFEAARGEIDRIIGGLGGGDQMTLIQVGKTPVVLAAATTERNLLREALATAQVENGEADWAGAVALASGAAQGFRDARVVVVSDGGLPAELPTLPAEVVYVPVGTSRGNVALTALATRNTEEGVQLLASVQNYGLVAQSALLTIRLGETIFDSRQIEVAAEAGATATWLLPDDVTLINAELRVDGDDYLALDNRAWAVHEGGVSNRALLVTPPTGNIFLEKIYAVLPGIEAFKGTSGAEITDDFDLYIFDSTIVPEPLPPGDLLIINPQVGGSIGPQVGALFNVVGTIPSTQTTVTRLASEPLLQFVDWSNIHIQQAKRVEAPWARGLVTAEGGELLLAGQYEGQRVAIMTFALQESDLPLQITFPILMANLTSWLSPGRAFEAVGGIQPGELVPLTPGASTEEVRVVLPNQTTWVAEVEGEGEIVFDETGGVGLYQVLLRDGTGTRSGGTFPVNLFNPRESAIGPRDVINIGQSSSEDSEGGDVGQRELWPWLALLAFVILLVEWWLYQEGATWRPLQILWAGIKEQVRGWQERMGRG
ncbi:MAG TPA: VWA domain-containing protein [Anaerolineae bacterium]|nr:VWA domain-containing protein [Anaerolineae bacterium]